ncbi:hypothetical protein [Methylibium sp.]|uniref:hypothetical protein n=1 Tax=Methylibium sp. TaxID=2067992 RepID=UPI00180AAE99|nr:hypothetical protein [Methylibium sp.]MBA3590476.1 hypothetical protein [Methylibium sp.]
MGLWDNLSAIASNAAGAAVSSGADQLQTYVAGRVDPSAADRLLPPGVAPAAIVPAAPRSVETQAPAIAHDGPDALARPTGALDKAIAFARTKTGMVVLVLVAGATVYWATRKG